MTKMSKRQLKDKAIDIKGKDYVLVSDRVNYFTDEYPNGSIVTELISSYDSDVIVIRATVTPDVDKPERQFVDYAQEVIGSTFINKTSAMENASTSAVGRALAYMGIGVLDSIASVDEIGKAESRSKNSEKTATDKQIEWLRGEAARKSNLEHETDLDNWIKDVVGARPQQILVYQVKKAVDKIKAYEVPKRKLDDSVEVTDADLDKFNKGEIPF